MKSFQQMFLERLEKEANELDFTLVAQHSASNVLSIDFLPDGEGFTSVLTMEAHFSRNQTVFHFNNSIMKDKGNPNMAIVGSNVSEADVVLDAIKDHLHAIR